MGSFATLVLLSGVIGGCSASSSTYTTSSETSSTATATTSASEPTQQEEAPRVARTSPTEASAMSTCAEEVRAGTHTTCQFAENVRAVFASAKESGGVPPADVGTYSPVTRRYYKLKCVLIADGTTVECRSGTAEVVFPIQGEPASAHEGPPTSTPEPSEESGGSGTEEGEDEVGSSSHAGDAKFCSEHECIGSFTTEEGHVVECSDGSYSHAGGISGACSHHGGESE